jgi:hypothetical protein
MPGARRGTGQQSGRSIGRGRRRRLPVLVNETLVASRRELPMYRQRDAFLAALDACSTLVLVGETGSGKSTQIPQFLYEAGYAGAGSRIGVTQPRRVAAQTVAKRVAAEMGVTLGQEVGYSVRFDDCTSASTVVKYLTDGMLLREAMGDADLSKYSVIVLDEAHERSLHTDILLGLIKALQRERRTRARKGVRPLKVIVMSATLNASLFADFFHDSAVFRVEGRQHPVDVMYTLEPEADYVDAALIAVLQIHLDEKPGDVLLFLTGQAEIEQMETLLTEVRWSLLVPPPSAPSPACLCIFSRSEGRIARGPRRRSCATEPSEMRPAALLSFLSGGEGIGHGSPVMTRHQGDPRPFGAGLRGGGRRWPRLTHHRHKHPGGRTCRSSRYINRPATPCNALQRPATPREHGDCRRLDTRLQRDSALFGLCLPDSARRLDNLRGPPSYFNVLALQIRPCAEKHGVFSSASVGLKVVP